MSFFLFLRLSFAVRSLSFAKYTHRLKTRRPGPEMAFHSLRNRVPRIAEGRRGPAGILCAVESAERSGVNRNLPLQSRTIAQLLPPTPRRPPGNASTFFTEHVSVADLTQR